MDLYVDQRLRITDVVKRLMRATGRTWQQLYPLVSTLLRERGVMRLGRGGTKFGHPDFKWKQRTCRTCQHVFEPAAVNQRFCLTCSGGTSICAYYGITVADYKKMFDDQCGLCAICSTDLSMLAPRLVHIDHCHKTGTVRGILCQRCNHRLAVLDDEEWCSLAGTYRQKPGIAPRCKCYVVRSLEVKEQPKDVRVAS